jgi:hypothetical protein
MRTYVGTFLIAFVTLALEVALTRILSVVAWYHLAFFAISTAMLGMTAGAVTVYLKPRAFEPDKLSDSLAKSCLAFAMATPVMLVLLCLLPISLGQSIMSLFGLLFATAACALPFYFSGIAVAAVLTKCDLPIGKLYAADLIGASLGCLFVLAGLEFLDAPSLILLCAAIGFLAANAYAWGSKTYRLKTVGIVLFIGMLVAVRYNARTSFGIRPVVVKGHMEDPREYLLEKWNSFSRVVVYRKQITAPQCWGPSPKLPDTALEQHLLVIDGAAGTTLRRFSNDADLDHLHYDVTNIGYFIRPTGDACVIGVGGGRDVQSAVIFGHKKVTGVDINPVFIDLLTNKKRFRDFCGIGNREGVHLVVDEARSYLSRHTEKYSTIQMSLIDTWAATGAGAFSLSENGLYTVEAWQLFLSRLDDNGIYTVSRWYNPSQPGETGRMLSLAVETLLKSGVTDPAKNIVMVSSNKVCTLLLSPRPFSQDDLVTLGKVIVDKQYVPVVMPGMTSQFPILKKIADSKSSAELRLAIKDEELNFDPPTDENPYFFNLLRPSSFKKYVLHPTSVGTDSSGSEAGVKKGNLVATLTLCVLLMALIVLTLVTIIVPLVIKTRMEGPTREGPAILWSGAIYFILIGAGFMFVEIALIQRLSVFLGHPVYALGILLFTMILSTGIGSFASEKIALDNLRVLFSYPLIAAGSIIAIRFILALLLPAMVTSSMPFKIIVSIIVIFPVGYLLGFFFPTGMRLLRNAAAAETPWYWALNGVFGVLCSALAVFVSINVGISANFYLAAICYLAILPALKMICSLPRSQVKTTPVATVATVATA